MAKEPKDNHRTEKDLNWFEKADQEFLEYAAKTSWGGWSLVLLEAFVTFAGLNELHDFSVAGGPII